MMLMIIVLALYVVSKLICTDDDKEDDDDDNEDDNDNDDDDDDAVLALYIGSRQIWAASRWWRHSWENSILPPSLLYLQDNLDEKYSSKIQVKEETLVKKYKDIYPEITEILAFYTKLTKTLTFNLTIILL